MRARRRAAKLPSFDPNLLLYKENPPGLAGLVAAKKNYRNRSKRPPTRYFRYTTK